uniref:Uncharacterized protein n=1 Tax=Anguilla anguilla TaxID=7936 RepID=A0A0E9VS13_ANGAN
MLLLKDALNWR